jgi:protein-disulfide isomerase
MRISNCLRIALSAGVMRCLAHFGPPAGSPLLMGLGLALLIPGPATAASSEEVAAIVNGEKIFVHDIDVPSRAKITKLREEIHALAARTIERLIDEHLQARTTNLPTPQPAPVTDDAVRAFRESQIEDFEGPTVPGRTTRDPTVQQAAIRHYLEQRAHEAAEAETRRRLREKHHIEIFVPEAQEIERSSTPERKVAEVDGVTLHGAELEQAAALWLYRLRGELYRERRRNLDTAIEDLLLTQEAHRRGMTRQALVGRISKEATVTDEGIRWFIEAERQAGRPVPTPERARLYLAFRAAYAERKVLVDRLYAAAEIQIMLKEPVAPRLAVSEADAPMLGLHNGPRLVVYTNYRCGPCRVTHREIDQLRAEDQTVQVIFHDFIPVYDPVATEAAGLARCAAQLGAFERMRNELLAREPPEFGKVWYEDAALLLLAGKLGIDATAFTQCLASAKVGRAIEHDTARARQLGFDEAPAFLAEGMPLSGMQSATRLARTLRLRKRH